MSTIKKNFNIWTGLMLVGCLALAILVTQPLLAKADNEGGNDIIIDTTFADTRSMSLDALNIFNAINIGNSAITKSGNFLSICTLGNCINLKSNKVFVSKLQIGEGSSAITFSGNMILNASGDNYILFDDVTETYAKDEDLITWLTKYNTQEILYKYGLFDSKTAGGIAVADQFKPRFVQKEQGYNVSFKNDDFDNNCSASNAGSLHYLESANGSKLIMCMKMGDGTYSGVILQDTTNLQ